MERNNPNVFDIELPDLENLSEAHLQLLSSKIEIYESAYKNSKKQFTSQDEFIDKYVSHLKKEILDSVNLNSDDRNTFIIILDKFLVYNAQRIYSIA